MREQEKEAVDDNVELIVEAIKLMEKKVADQLEIAQSIVPEKGDKGDKGQDGLQGRDGLNGKDGRDGKNGLDGKDGEDGVSVTDAKIDFDGSLIITLSTGREINVGEVVAPDLAERLSVISTMSTNTAVANITSGTIDGAVIGGTTPAAGTFTTLGSTTVTNIQANTYIGSGLSYDPIVSGAAAYGRIQLYSTGTGNTTFQNTFGGKFVFGTSSAAAQQFAIASTASAVNYVQVTGGATTKAVIQSSQGSDSNISFVTQTKGTGAIDLAAGSSGVNISNGGTVTAITRTAGGSNYSTIPSLAISAPTTAGGVQATATPQMAGQTVTVQAAGSSYVVGNTLTVVGGTSSTAAQLRVDSIDGSGGVTATSFVNTAGAYSVLPTNPVSVTGGAGSGATFNITQWFFASAGPIITNAGSGYVEQPTVSFSGGGGSGAAAYATVGTNAVVSSIGSALRLANAGGLGFQVGNAGTATVNYLSAQGSSAGNAVLLSAAGSDSNIAVRFSSLGTSSVSIFTNNSGQEQLRVAHTASAVNYVQVTGNVTGSGPIISAQGSDASADLLFSAKGTAGSHVFRTNSTVRQFQVNHVTSAVNYATVTGNVASSSPVFSVAGTDTNIDLTLTPKGTGNVRFGTYTGTILTPTGYVEIKDSGGTVRRLLVG
jgi:hypothetical protein